MSKIQEYIKNNISSYDEYYSRKPSEKLMTLLEYLVYNYQFPIKSILAIYDYNGILVILLKSLIDISYKDLRLLVDTWKSQFVNSGYTIHVPKSSLYTINTRRITNSELVGIKDFCKIFIDNLSISKYCEYVSASEEPFNTMTTEFLLPSHHILTVENYIIENYEHFIFIKTDNPSEFYKYESDHQVAIALTNVSDFFTIDNLIVEQEILISEDLIIVKVAYIESKLYIKTNNNKFLEFISLKYFT